MKRREFLAGAAAAIAAPALAAKRIDRSRVSAITDEIARSPAAAIEFASQYGLKWLELRAVPGVRGEYFQLPVNALKQSAKEFKDAGLKISFLNTSMLKFGMPGVEHASPRVKESRSEEHTSE